MAETETTEERPETRPETPEEEQALQPEETVADQASEQTGEYEVPAPPEEPEESEETVTRPIVGDGNNPEAGGDASYPKADEANVEAMRAGATDGRDVEGTRLEPYGEGSPAQRDVAPYEVREAQLEAEEKAKEDEE